MTAKPNGEITIQTLAMPSDTNPNGDIFGGWLVSQMDLGGAILAKRISHGRVVTVAINSMTFLKPVHVGSLVKCYARLIKKGRTSMTVHVEVWAETLSSQESYCVTDGIFVFVAVDDHGKPKEIPQS